MNRIVFLLLTLGLFTISCTKSSEEAVEIVCKLNESSKAEIIVKNNGKNSLYIPEFLTFNYFDRRVIIEPINKLRTDEGGPKESFSFKPPNFIEIKAHSSFDIKIHLPQNKNQYFLRLYYADYPHRNSMKSESKDLFLNFEEKNSKTLEFSVE